MRNTSSLILAIHCRFAAQMATIRLYAELGINPNRCHIPSSRARYQSGLRIRFLLMPEFINRPSQEELINATIYRRCATRTLCDYRNIFSLVTNIHFIFAWFFQQNRWPIHGIMLHVSKTLVHHNI
jgi:hypothetical protein